MAGLIAGRAKWGVDGSSEAWNLNFNNGQRNSNHLGNSNNKRALCVRVPERDAVAELFTFENLHRAYLSCRRGKRGSTGALRFEAQLEANLFALLDELRARRYEPSPSACFVTAQPKAREIFAAPFRDRVVHHLIVGHLEPYWERRFIHDSYACRRGRGTHRAVRRLQSFMRRASANGTRRAFFLHVDIRSFFVRIHKATLLDMVLRGLARQDPPWREPMAWLLERVLLRDPAADARRFGGRFQTVPQHKSLFFTGNHTGLPIGNYTSQFLANVYLDVLDQHVKHELRARYYLRYVDDLVLVHEDRRVLAEWEGAVDEFLRARLHLELNGARRKLAPISSGCDFLGYVVRRTHLLVRRRTVRRCRQKLEAIALEVEREVHGRRVTRFPSEPSTHRACAVLLSYGGQFHHASSRRLRRGLLGRNPWIHLLLERRRERPARRDRPMRPFVSLAQQVQWFRRRWPGAVLLFRVGAFWEAFGPDRWPVAAALGLRPGRWRPGLGRGVGIPARLGLERLLNRLPRRIVCVGQTEYVQGNVRRRRVEAVVASPEDDQRTMEAGR